MPRAGNLTDIIRILGKTPLFGRIDSAKLKVMVMMGQTTSYDAGEWVFHGGAESDAAFVVLNGKVDVVVDTPSGQITVATLGQGELFGEMAAITGAARSAGIRASEDVLALRLERDTLLKMLREFPDLSLSLLRIMAQRLEATTSELAEKSAS